MQHAAAHVAECGRGLGYATEHLERMPRCEVLCAFFVLVAGLSRASV